MKVEGKKRSWEVKERREKKGENAYLFDAGFTKCVGTVPREQWEGVIAICSGDIVRAATYCGLEGVPAGARALWGKSPEDALAAYKLFQQAKASGVPLQELKKKLPKPKRAPRGPRPGGPPRPR